MPKGKTRYTPEIKAETVALARSGESTSSTMPSSR